MEQPLKGKESDRIKYISGFYGKDFPVAFDGCVFLLSLFLQIDTYGILGTIHCFLFLDYMKVHKDAKGRWKINKSFKRYVPLC